MPRPNQYLLLYVLDLLSVFARKSDKNLMTASNLAVIFRPGLIAHPEHEMVPREHDLSQRVLEFLIAQQDWFILDIPPPPQRAQVTSPTPTSMTVMEEDVHINPSSDSGAEDPLSSGWKMVGKQTRRITRRRTQDDVTTPSAVEEDTELSPVPESPQTPTEGATGVTRRRTLPSGKVSKDISPEDKQRARVLRKAKRTSSHQPKKSEPVTP